MTRWLLAAACITLTAGCGTTRTTDSSRTATEQLLISDAIDRAVQSVDFNPLVGQSVYLDDSRLGDAVDRDYLISTLRQHLLASGCVLRDSRTQADFIVEARAGVIGTDRSDLLFGIPATNVPQLLPIQAGPAAIPEVPLAKRRDQRGVAKISVFAFHRESGRPVWQSGLAMEESSSNDVWLFGAGPFQHGTVYSAPKVASTAAGKKATHAGADDGNRVPVTLAQGATFTSPAELVAEFRRLPATEQLAQTGSTPPAAVEAQTAAAHVAAAPSHVEPAAYTPDRKEGETLLPNLAEMATKKQMEAELTARVFGSQLLRPRSTKTVTINAPRETDPIQLPQPRFDSL